MPNEYGPGPTNEFKAIVHPPPLVEQGFRNRADFGVGLDIREGVAENVSAHDRPLEFGERRTIASSDPFAWVCGFCHFALLLNR